MTQTQQRDVRDVKNFRAMSRVMLISDLRDISSLIFTFLVPAGLMVGLILVFGPIPSAYGGSGDSVNEVGSNVVAFGAAFVGIFAGASHLALWRENGMFRVLRAFPISTGTILLAQGVVGVLFSVVQVFLLVAIASTPWLGMTISLAAPLTLVPVALGYLVFFFFGVLLGIAVPSMAGVSMLSTLIVVPLGMVGGAMLPMQALPGWAQIIAPFTPLYHLRVAVTKPLVDLGTWADAGIGCLYLLVVSALLFLIVRAMFRFR